MRIRQQVSSVLLDYPDASYEKIGGIVHCSKQRVHQIANSAGVTRKRRPPNTLKLVFSRLAKSSGVNRLHAHLCRHTFAINYLLNGGDIFSLREILGHTTLEMVNHYLHFTSSQITSQHRKYSPMDRMQEKEGEVKSS